VRELQNVIERAVILSKGSTLSVPVADLQSAASPAVASTPADSLTLTDAEREHILRALRETNWVLGGPEGAAARLGMKRSTLHWKMKKLGISRPNSAPTSNAPTPWSERFTPSWTSPRHGASVSLMASRAASLERFNRVVERPDRAGPPRTHVTPFFTAAYGVSPV